MNLLDTDALSLHLRRDAVGEAIDARIAASEADFATTAVTAFELVGGAVTPCRRLERTRKDLVPGFDLVREVVEYLARWRGRILPYDADAERVYRAFPPRLRQELGPDARIAAIALARGDAVWTCNVRDYRQVPGLVVVRADTGVTAT